MTEAEFLKQIEAVDQKLTAAGTPTYQRSLHAFLLMARGYSGPVTASPVETASFPPFVGPRLLDSISAWYRQRYGRRMNMPDAIGKVPLLVKGEVFLARIPLVYGSPVISIITVLSLIEDLTPGLTATLTEQEVLALMERWQRGYELVYEMQDLRPVWRGRPPASREADGLLESALLDRECAVRTLGAHPVDLPNACFHAQQLAEKMLKAFLLVRGTMSMKALKGLSHKLTDLAAECEARSSAFVAIQPDIAMLRCITMDIRYSPPPLRAQDVAELIWAAYRVAGLAACEISGAPRRLAGRA